jgi:hypothetical protein
MHATPIIAANALISMRFHRAIGVDRRAADCQGLQKLAHKVKHALLGHGALQVDVPVVPVPSDQ